MMEPCEILDPSLAKSAAMGDSAIHDPQGRPTSPSTDAADQSPAEKQDGVLDPYCLELGHAEQEVHDYQTNGHHDKPSDEAFETVLDLLQFVAPGLHQTKSMFAPLCVVIMLKPLFSVIVPLPHSSAHPHHEHKPGLYHASVSGPGNRSPTTGELTDCRGLPISE
jgi:hypothetical protein